MVHVLTSVCTLNSAASPGLWMGVEAFIFPEIWEPVKVVGPSLLASPKPTSLTSKSQAGFA